MEQFDKNVIFECFGITEKKNIKTLRQRTSHVQSLRQSMTLT